MQIALCGNPNVGKTTLFNRLTNSAAPVGNWHGVTVDARKKHMVGNRDITVVDLPGTYSLTARSAEECITRDGVLFGGFDVIVCVAEVNNLRRNLYLLTQVAEAGKKVVLVVNMMDEARGKVDLELLSRRLGIPVVGTSERSADPRAAIVEAAKRASVPKLDYAADARVVAEQKRLAGNARLPSSGFTPLYAAVKILERDGEVMKKLCVKPSDDSSAACADCGLCSGERDIPARLRYGFIDRALAGVVEKRRGVTLTEKLDRVLVGKAALPLFLLVMAAVFVITFEAGKPLSDLIGKLPALAATPIANTGMPEWVKSLLIDGLLAGVGGVLAFLPQVVLLFLLTALLQDSGYMSRVAFVTDGFFRRFGLSGRAAFSIILGLGCSQVAVLSARAVAERETRLRAAFIAPYMPCSARLAVFTAIAAYFGLPSIVVAAMYVLAFLVSLGVLAATRRLFGDGTSDELLMEMPPYRLPSARRVAKSVLCDMWSFVSRVGSVVLCVSVIMWALSNFSIGYGFTGGSDKSIMSTFAGFVAPIFAPVGFGNWRAVTALISGIAAKETVISVIAALGGLGAVFGSTAAAVSFMIFTCLYLPCVATLAALAKECGIKYALLSAVVHTVAAYLASLVFYRSAVLYETNLKIFIILWACAACVACAVVVILKCVSAKRRRAEKLAG